MRVRCVWLGKIGVAAALCLLCRGAVAQTAEEGAVVQLLHSGRDAMQQGDVAGAEGIFRHAVEVAPTLSDGYLGLGLVQLRRGELDESVKSLGRAVELNPRLPGAHMFLGIAQYQMGQNEAAITSLRSDIELEPRNVEALTWLGIVELGAGRPEQATAPLDEAAVLNPKDEHVLYYRGRAHMLVAEAAFRQLSELNPDSALVHRGMAESFDVAGQPEKAVAEYEAAIKKDPTNADLYNALGEAEQKLSRVDAAKQAYEEELKLNPQSALALYNLGKIDVEQGKAESGVAVLRKAEAAHAAAAPVDFYLGLGLAELGQNAEAAQWLEKSLANKPSPFIEQGAWYQLVRVYPKLNRKADAQHALEELKRLLDLLQQQKDATARQAAAGGMAGPDGALPATTEP